MVLDQMQVRSSLNKSNVLVLLLLISLCFEVKSYHRRP